MFDRQILFDPLEEGLDLPTLAVDLGDRECRQVEAIGQEDEVLVCFRIAKGNTAQAIRVGELRFGCGEQDALIAAQAGSFVDIARGGPGIAQIVLGADDEADLALMQRLEPRKIEITAVDDNDCASRPMNHIEDIDVVHLAGGDMYENGNGAAQVDDGVGFDCRLGRAEVGPGEQRQAQVDGRGIHRIERLLEAQAAVLAVIQLDRHGDQTVTQRFEQSPVAPLVRIGQSGTGYSAANPDVVELGALRVQTSNQIAQAFASGELRIHHAKEMTPGREVLDAMVRRVPIDQMLEMTEWNEIQQLCENRPAAIHGVASFAKKIGKDTAQKPLAISNRRN